MKFSKKGALKNPPAVFIPAGLFAVEGEYKSISSRFE